MRIGLLSVCLVALLSISTPAEGQLRTDAAVESPARLYDNGGGNVLLNTVFNPRYFSMGHSLEFTAGGGGGYSSSLAMYTNSLMWNFSDKLAARADISVAYSPFSNGPQGFGGVGNYSSGSRVFLRNAQVAYSPSENLHFQVSINNSPYGYYGSPYGLYRYR
ncbi:MAG: hypothetical protein HKN43_12220 [Rhodothermales bacterium]|nr:hypothetical protein [Rhodothermales bacterium]